MPDRLSIIQLIIDGEDQSRRALTGVLGGVKRLVSGTIASFGRTMRGVFNLRNTVIAAFEENFGITFHEETRALTGHEPPVE